MKFQFDFLFCIAAMVFATASQAIVAQAQTKTGYQEISRSDDRVSVIQGSSKRLKFPYDIPELTVENPEIVQATPMRIDEILVSGLRPGHTSLTVSDSNNGLHEIRIVVEVDTRPLEMALARNFPDSNITINALQNGIVLAGYVSRPEQIDIAQQIAQDYFATNVISMLQVQGVQNVAIQVKVYEVSRSKLRRLGIDWQLAGTDWGIISNISQLITSPSVTAPISGTGQGLSGGILRDSTQFAAFLDVLEQRNVARIKGQPVLIAQNGRPAEFLEGGEIPFLIQQGLGNSTVDFRPFGTKLDIVPIIEGQGRMTLEVRAEVSQPAEDFSNGTGLIGFRVRRVNTSVNMRAGHTLALAGDYQEINNTESRGIPKLMDRPLFGSFFRRVQDEFSETEIVFLITPNLISDVDPSQVAGPFPGETSRPPSDRELYLYGHVEVPVCQDDCPVNSNLGAPMIHQQGPGMIGPVNAIHPHHHGEDTHGHPQTNRNNSNNPSQPIRQANQSSGFNWPTTNRR